MSEPESMNPPPAGRLVARRPADGSDGVFALENGAIIGRFDPSVGPIAIDLGGLPDGGYVSRRHAEIVWENDQWHLRDLGSSNGTFRRRSSSEWEKIEGLIDLENDDELAFGNAHLLVQIENEVADEATAEPDEAAADEEAIEMDGAEMEPSTGDRDPE